MRLMDTARLTAGRLLVPLGLAALLSGVLIATGPARPAAAASSAGTWQLIKVTATSHSTTYATLRAYRVSGGHRTLVYGPWTARVGYNGVAQPGRKREGDGRTPSGTYGFSFFFGVQHRLKFSFSFRHAYRYDVWDDDPASHRYNEWVNTHRHRAGAGPEPMHQVPAYDYAAVIAYNVKRVPGRGSAIFLHTGTGRATAGCVSLSRHQLIQILRWLQHREHPEIRISG